MPLGVGASFGGAARQRLHALGGVGGGEVVDVFVILVEGPPIVPDLGPP